jgi:hypothetical protein
MNSETGLHYAHNDGGTSGRTNTGRRVETVKTNTTGCELVEVGCLDDFIAITTKPATHIFQINPEDIRPVSRLNGQTEKT